MRYLKTMTYPEFSNKLTRYKDSLRRAYRLREKGRLNPNEKWARDALAFADEVGNTMADKDGNFRRWLRLETCGFRHPVTGNDIMVEIGDDHEAIYNFLLYCKIRYSIEGTYIYLPGKGGRKITLAGYKLLQKIFHFN